MEETRHFHPFPDLPFSFFSHSPNPPPPPLLLLPSRSPWRWILKLQLPQHHCLPLLPTCLQPFLPVWKLRLLLNLLPSWGLNVKPPMLPDDQSLYWLQGSGFTQRMRSWWSITSSAKSVGSPSASISLQAWTSTRWSLGSSQVGYLLFFFFSSLSLISPFLVPLRPKPSPTWCVVELLKQRFCSSWP